MLVFKKSEGKGLKMIRPRDNAILIDIYETHVDRRRGLSDNHFILSKWGMYYSTLEMDKLREEEEREKFAHVLIRG